MDQPTEHAASTELDLTPTPEPDHTAGPRSTAQRIFFGPFGLRAGWSLLIYFAIVLSVNFGVRAAIKHFKPKPAQTSSASPATAKPTPPKPAATAPVAAEPQALAPIIVGEAIIFGVFFALSLLMARIERRPLSRFGLGGSNVISRFFIGAFWGLTALSLLIAVLHAAHLLVFDERLLHGPSVLGWGSLSFLAFLLVGLQEEYIFRGYLQFTLTRGLVSIGNLISPKHARAIAFWIASIITSALFFVAHTNNGGETKLGLFMVFLAGITFVIALWRTGSLWWAIGFHAAWDWAQSFLYGVPDSGGLEQGRLFATHAVGNPLYSGGTVGPEGSVFVIPTLALVIIILLVTRSSPQPPLETDSQEPDLRIA